jgi:hypothetical protein
MISKRKQNFQIEMKFDPELVKLCHKKSFKDTNHLIPNMSFSLKNDTMDFGTKITCEFVPIKGFKEVQSRIRKLRNFAKKCNSNNYEPTTVIVINDKDMYCASLMAGDSGK